MNLTVKNIHQINIALLAPSEGEVIIADLPSALDLIMTAKYEASASRIALPKSAVADPFFVLSSGLAGEILQKYINYGVKLAIYGDYSHYTSKPLKDFIYESNQGRDFFFVATEAEALLRLSTAL